MLKAEAAKQEELQRQESKQNLKKKVSAAASKEQSKPTSRATKNRPAKSTAQYATEPAESETLVVSASKQTIKSTIDQHTSGSKKTRQVTFAAGTDDEQSAAKSIRSGTIENLREDTFGAVKEEPADHEVEENEDVEDNEEEDDD